MLLTVVLDVMSLAVVVGATVAFGFGVWGASAAIAIYGLAPVLVAYNTQLTSRGLGNLLLLVKLLLELAASMSTGWPAALLWVSAVVVTGLVFLTHKMTTQFMLALWPFWAIALGSWAAAAVPLGGLLFAGLVSGPSFFALQWKAHADIVAFWHRNWRDLGCHPFRRSPLYGDPSARDPGLFHQPGVRGFVGHAKLAIGHLPAAWLLPLTLPFTPAPPLWLAIWLCAALAMTVATLIVPALKCLGGGHLYLFNAAPPAALWWALVLASHSIEGVVLFALALTATTVSLAAGWRRRRQASSASDETMKALVSHLLQLAPTRVALYPFAAAERIAAETPHSVFWGGHGYGFRTLEPYWPVVREPVGSALRRHGVTHAALDVRWWPEGEGVMDRETGDSAPVSIGAWRVFRLC